MHTLRSLSRLHSPRVGHLRLVLLFELSRRSHIWRLSRLLGRVESWRILHCCWVTPVLLLIWHLVECTWVTPSILMFLFLHALVFLMDRHLSRRASPSISIRRELRRWADILHLTRHIRLRLRWELKSFRIARDTFDRCIICVANVVLVNFLNSVLLSSF